MTDPPAGRVYRPPRSLELVAWDAQVPSGWLREYLAAEIEKRRHISRSAVSPAEATQPADDYDIESRADGPAGGLQPAR